MALVQPSMTVKELGAYYTDESVAAFLASWAIRSPHATVIDPSFGGGVFLESAATRLKELGNPDPIDVYGIELNPAVHAAVAGDLTGRFGFRGNHLINSDFFAVEPDRLPLFDAVIGNPPFIRYQTFSGPTRKLALERAAQHGVRLSQAASSWAPFLIHAISYLKRGGAIGMVLPMELVQAVYARPVLAFLSRQFARIQLIAFATPLFPELSQGTILLLAEDRGGTHQACEWLELRSVADLPVNSGRLPKGSVLDTGAIAEGRDRITKSLAPTRVRELYDALIDQAAVTRLGDVANVGIGYVSGANKFFHLSEFMVDEYNLPPDVLVKSVFRGKAFAGPYFTETDWSKASGDGHAGYVLRISPEAELSDALASYLALGEKSGVSSAYKCRVRHPWYAVPGVRPPDAFITYMSGKRPHFAINSATAAAPNTLLTVNLKPTQSHQSVTSIAAGWFTSLANLSTELEGHAMGGGMLKLEPREAQKVILPVESQTSEELLAELSLLQRAGRLNDAQNLADERLLVQGLGLSKRDIGSLRETAMLLRDRRHKRRGKA